MTLLRNRREAALLLAGGIVAAAAIPRRSPAAGAGGRRVSLPARPAAIAIDPIRTALLVVDMQNDFGARGGMFDRAGVDISGIQAVVPTVQSVLALARQAGMPVVYLKMGYRADLRDAGPVEGPNRLKHAPMHIGELGATPDGRPTRILVRETWGTDIVPELAPRAGDTVLYKTRFSGFVNTQLDARLRALGADTLIVTGCTTSVCVESTVRDAFFRDYRCIVLEDCAAEPLGAGMARTNHEASLLVMQTDFGWVSDSRALASALAG
jgi:ureidoacrylate peracid hydrolase